MTVIRLGTRGSALALWQAHEVRARLVAAHGLPEGAVEITVMKTSGDRIQDRPLSEVGGKGLFTKELEEALLAGTIDLAVHSMKDVATKLSPGLIIAAVLEREDPRDAFISTMSPNFAALPIGAVIGTSSLRRQAQALHARPDLQVVGFRGNVETRLKKLADGVASATFLAVAGLKRLGLAQHITAAIELSEMLPAVAQGAVGVEIRADDERTAQLLGRLDHQPTHLAISAERAFLARLDGSCRTPIGGLAELDANNRITFRGEILSPDGRQAYSTGRTGPAQTAIQMGEEAAHELLSMAGPAFFATVQAAAGNS